MANIGALNVSLGMETGAFLAGSRAAGTAMKSLGTQAQATGAQVSRLGSGFAAFGRGGGSSIQNASYQIADFAVQVGGGTSALRALSQQLPQVLGGFGPIGAVISAVAAVSLGLYAALKSNSGEAKTTDDAIKGLSAAMSQAKSAGDLLKASQADLALSFGSVAAGASLAASQTRDAIAGIATGMRETGTSALAPLANELARIDAALAELPAGAVAAGDDIREFAHAFEMSEEMAAALVGQMRAFGDATASPAMASALLAIYQHLSDAKVEMGALPPVAESLRATLSGVVGELGAATAQTNDLGAALKAAGDEAQRLAQARYAGERAAADAARARIPGMAATEDSRTSAGRGIGLSYQDRQGLPASDPRSPNFRSYVPPKGGGGGSGAAKATDATRALDAALKDLKSQAQQVFDETRTPQEQFASRMQQLNGLVQSGRLDMETYQRAVVLAQNDLAGVGQAGVNAFQTMQQSFATAITGMIDGTGSFKDAMLSMFSQIGGGMIQSGVGALFGQFKIPGFASGTNFAPGGLSLVGERGPELVNLPRGSRVTPNRALGGVTLNFAPVVNAAGADATALAQVRQELHVMRDGMHGQILRTLANPRKQR